MAALHGLSTGGEPDRYLHLQPRTRQILGPPVQQIRPGLSNDTVPLDGSLNHAAFRCAKEPRSTCGMLDVGCRTGVARCSAPLKLRRSRRPRLWSNVGKSRACVPLAFPDLGKAGWACTHLVLRKRHEVRLTRSGGNKATRALKKFAPWVSNSWIFCWTKPSLLKFATKA